MVVQGLTHSRHKALIMERGKQAAQAAFYLGITGAVALGLGAAPVWADVKAGVDAWEAGDYAGAVAEWQGPASAGDADALFNLAQAYRLGRGVAADSTRARELYADAAAKGHIKAADNYGLLLFQEGEQQKAMPMVRAAAERGDPRAQYVVGLAHFNGDYAPRDWVRAYALMTLANGAGLPQAASALAQMDQYVPLNQRQQAQLLARKLEDDAVSQRAAAFAAADLGSAPAMVPLAAAAPVQAAPAVAVSSPVAAPVPARQPAVAGSAAGAAALPSAAASVSAPVAQAAVAAPTVAAPAAARLGGTWRVQLGAFGVAGNADKLWGQLAGNPALAGTRKALVATGNITRLQAVGFASKTDAEKACTVLQRQGQACMVAGNS